MPNDQPLATDPIPSDEIKVAILGFGLAGRVFHAPFVSAVPGLKLTTIVQRKGARRATHPPPRPPGGGGGGGGLRPRPPPWWCPAPPTRPITRSPNRHS